MTAVPKPLKFLRPHYETLTKLYDEWPASDDKNSLADVLSVIGMTFSDEDRQDTLKYRLLAPTQDISSWGHEYVRHLALEIGEVYGKRIAADEPTADLVDLALALVPLFLKSNQEADAVDLMSERKTCLPRFFLGTWKANIIAHSRDYRRAAKVRGREHIWESLLVHGVHGQPAHIPRQRTVPPCSP